MLVCMLLLSDTKLVILVWHFSIGSCLYAKLLSACAIVIRAKVGNFSMGF